MLGSLSVLLSLVAPAFVSAAASTNYFVNPTPLDYYYQELADYPAYEVGQVLDVSWVTNYTSVDLVLWQAGVYASSNHIFQRKTSGTTYLWIIDVDTFETDGVNATTGTPNNVFNLVMYSTGSTGALSFSSQYFNVTSPTSNSSAATASSSASPTTTYVTAQAGPSATTASPGNGVYYYGYGDSTDESNDRDIRLGLGIGLGLGVPLLITVACLAYMLGARRRRRDRESQQRPVVGSPGAAIPNANNSNVPTAQPAPALVEHYGPQAWNSGIQSTPMQQNAAPVSSAPTRQPIVTAKYQ